MIVPFIKNKNKMVKDRKVGKRRMKKPKETGRKKHIIKGKPDASTAHA